MKTVDMIVRDVLNNAKEYSIYDIEKVLNYFVIRMDLKCQHLKSLYIKIDEEDIIIFSFGVIQI